MAKTSFIPESARRAVASALLSEPSLWAGGASAATAIINEGWPGPAPVLVGVELECRDETTAFPPPPGLKAAAEEALRTGGACTFRKYRYDGQESTEEVRVRACRSEARG